MRFVLVMLALLAWSAPALAGPPYATDDPEPTDTGHWEIYAYADAAFDNGTRAGSFGFDLNYGPVDDVQLTATLPLDFDSAVGTGAEVGDVELGVKWRILDDERHHRSLAVFPRVILPTARGGGRADFLLPVWGQQDLGKWSIFGGGGYTIHPGPGNRDYWQEGLAVTREVSDSLTLGAEVFHEGLAETGGHGSTLLGVGAVAALGGPFSLLLSGGPIVEDRTGHTAIRGFAAILTEF